MISIVIPINSGSHYPLEQILTQQCALVEDLEWEIRVESFDAVNIEQIVSRARYDWVLFVGSKVMPRDEHFIEKYVKQINKNKYDVCCGGKKANKTIEDESSLEWIVDAYEEKRLSVQYRRNNPYTTLTFDNLLINKRCVRNLNPIPHEHFLQALALGIQFAERKYSVRHINNPVISIEQHSNSDYLLQVEHAYDTLALKDCPYRKHSHIESIYQKVNEHHLLPLVKGVHWCFGKCLRTLLCSQFPFVHLFFLYKLGYYISQRDK